MTRLHTCTGGKWVSFGDSDGRVILWNLDTMAKATDADLHVMPVSKVCVSSDPKPQHSPPQTPKTRTSWPRVS